MEDNKTPEAPTPCTAGCGFYGNKIYNNMCSKCFKEFDEQNKKDFAAKEEKQVKSPVIPKETPSIQKEQEEPTVKVEQVEERQEEPAQAKVEEKEDEEKDSRPIQKNKGRCFKCRSKIPLAKQLANKCRCEYVFCDTHRYPDKHDCDFDHAKNDKDILAKMNPKLNDKPRGGNSFKRIDSL